MVFQCETFLPIKRKL